MNSLLPHHHHNSNACPQFTPSSKNTGSRRSCTLRSGCSRYFPSTFAGIGLSPSVGWSVGDENERLNTKHVLHEVCCDAHKFFAVLCQGINHLFFNPLEQRETIRTLTRTSVLADSEHFRRVLWLVSGTCFSSTDGLSSSLLLWQSCKLDEYNNANIFCVF